MKTWIRRPAMPARTVARVGRAVIVLLWALLSPRLGATAETNPALGSLEAHDRSGRACPLALVSGRVEAHGAGDMIEIAAEHVFRNPSAERLEGTFRFLLPQGAIVIGLSMEIGGKLEPGLLLEKEQARQVYREIVDRMRDPALLEWSGGTRFEMRVFPIEPLSDKRIVLRYLAPLDRDGESFRFVFPAPALALAPPDFRLGLDDVVIIDSAGKRQTADVVVPLSGSRPRVMREVKGDKTYFAVRTRPDWSRIPVAPPPPRRRLLVLVDVSRSALATRRLAADTLTALLGSLEPRDLVEVAFVDLTVHDPTGWRQTAPGAVETLRSLDADGATDLAAALEFAGAEAGRLDPEGRRGLQVVYVGDGQATWGETEPDKLVAVARDKLAGAAFYALALGREADTTLLDAIARAVGGRVARPQSPAEVQRFADWMRTAGPELKGASLTAPEGIRVLPELPQTLFRGDEWTALLEVPSGRAVPLTLTLSGATAAGPFAQDVSLLRGEDTPHVAQRWAVAEIGRLESAGASRQDVLAVSLGHGVLSRYTAFLVLEREERMRRGLGADADSDDPRISGRDLESLDASANLTPDRIQPGDPEIRISAPEDARSVVVTLPTGETRAARYDSERGVWTLRFLIDKDTPEGVYDVWVRVTRKDGRIELLRLHYTVDTHAPVVSVSLSPVAGRRGEFEVRAQQIVTAEDRTAGGIAASVAEDARHVEVRMPDGRLVILGLVKDGLFRGYWRPSRVQSGPVVLRVVAVDRALNERVSEVRLPPLQAVTADGR